MSIHEDWCDPGPRGASPIVDPAHPSRGTCPKCGYVGPRRERSGELYPHKRFDRYAPEPIREEDQ
jgi:hypothetical protein